MNTSRFRILPLFAAALTIGLAACGGSSDNDGVHVDLGGTVTGLTTSGLVLRSGTVSVAVEANATSFKFAEQASTGTLYAVTVLTQPAGATCTVTNGSGTVGDENITNVQVACALNGTLGGTISNLTQSGLILVNGDKRVEVAAGSTSFTFPDKVAPGQAYGVGVLPESSVQECTVTNGAGIMPATDVNSVQVSCQ